MILILTQKWDKHVDRVTEILDRRQVPYCRFETERLPREANISLRFDGTAVSQCLRIDKRLVNARDIKAIWYRRPGVTEVDPEMSEEDQKFARTETWQALAGLYRLLEDRFWVNPFGRTHAAEFKAYQLKVAIECGFEIPKTLISNSREDVCEFLSTTDGQVVYKAMSSNSRDVDGRPSAIFTSLVTSDDIRTHGERVSKAPCLFQALIPKAFELRVTVIGRSVFTDRIDAQRSEHTRLDWRRHYGEQTDHSAATIPDELEQRIRLMMRRLGLVFGCFDIAVTPDGRYVFFEINPNGQWAWVEGLTGLPVAEHFAAMLADATSEYAEPILPQEAGK